MSVIHVKTEDKTAQETNALQKLLASVINVLIVLIVFLPFWFLVENTLIQKFFFIGLFFLYNLLVLILNKNRCLGMVLTHTHWKEEYPLKNHITYTVLYTVSFATLLFWLYFPFDVFLVNMLLIQIPSILLTKTTLHGYLSGEMITMRLPLN